VTVRVRAATIADLAIVVELRLALLREYGDHVLYGRLRPDAEARAFASYISQIQSSDQIMLLAECGDGVAGILRCVDVIGSPLLHPDRYGYISSVYVRPGDRRLGILRAMLDRASDWCHERGVRELRLHNSSSNNAAIATWDALGFEVVEQVRVRALSV
jgi:ribosomal protein S18 acetylase RimI-like enzyme